MSALRDSLHDASFVTRLDPKHMYRLTVEFPDQCKRAIEGAQAADLPQWSAKQVILTGLGGSAAGGDFIRALMEADGTVPYSVNRDYFLPNCVNAETLVVACSYSGNTEETLSAYADAMMKGAKILCVTSGGKLAELAKANGQPCVIIPGGQPPRTALGFLLMSCLVALEKMGFVPAQDYAALIAHVSRCVDLWKVETKDLNPAKDLALALHGKLGVLYGLGSWQGLVANRWKGQINENSKNMTFANIYPELNHNEILGWVKCMEQGVAAWVGLVLCDGTESAKMKKRDEVTRRLTAEVCEWHTVVAPGRTLLEKMLALALLGDFVSLYLAALNGVDPENIDSINTLKNELSSVPF